MDQPMHAEEANAMYVMPWHFRAEDAEYGRDCILIATMLGHEVQALPLHAGFLPDLAANGG